MSPASPTRRGGRAPGPETRVWPVIGASAVGTMIEWYDFYIFGSLATIISPLFYPAGNDTLALIAYRQFAIWTLCRQPRLLLHQ